MGAGSPRGVTGAGEEEFSVDLPKLFPLAARENGESGPQGPGVGVKRDPTAKVSSGASGSSTHLHPPRPGVRTPGSRRGRLGRGWDLRFGGPRCAESGGPRAPEDVAEGIPALLQPSPWRG